MKLSARPACSVFNINDGNQATLLQHLYDYTTMKRSENNKIIDSKCGFAVIQIFMVYVSDCGSKDDTKG